MCHPSISDVYSGYISFSAGAAGGGAATLRLLELIEDAFESVTSNKAKNKSKKRNASSTAGGAVSPKPPKKGKGSPKHAGDTLYNKNNVRIDFEYYGNGNGNVHLHKNGAKYYYDSINNVFRTGASISSTLAPKAIQTLLYDPKIQRAVTRGIEIIQSLGGE